MASSQTPCPKWKPRSTREPSQNLSRHLRTPTRQGPRPLTLSSHCPLTLQPLRPSSPLQTPIPFCQKHSCALLRSLRCRSHSLQPPPHCCQADLFRTQNRQGPPLRPPCLKPRLAFSAWPSGPCVLLGLISHFSLPITWRFRNARVPCPYSTRPSQELPCLCSHCSAGGHVSGEVSLSPLPAS